jgi:hypothetical protein
MKEEKHNKATKKNKRKGQASSKGRRMIIIAVQEQN